MRLYLINRDFQLRYAGVALLVGLGSTCVTLGVVLVPLFQLNILRFPNFLPTPFLIAMLLAALVNFAIVASMSILVTHRIAGPMFSVVRYLHLVKERRALVPLKIRDSDDLRYLVRNINDFFEHLNRQNAADSARLDEVLTILASQKAESSAQAHTMIKLYRDDLFLRLIPQFAANDSAPKSTMEALKNS